MIRGLAAPTSAALLGSVLTACRAPTTDTGESTADLCSAGTRLAKVVPTKDLPPNDGPNILVVTTDDMRWDELGYVPNVRKYVAVARAAVHELLLAEPALLPGAGVVPDRGVLPQPPRLHPRGALRLRSLRRPPDARHGPEPGRLPDRAGRQVPQRLRRAALPGHRRSVGEPTCQTDGPTGRSASRSAGRPGRCYSGGTYNYRSFTENVNGKTVVQPRSLLLDRGR